ncbi:hypothetical protein [Bradyrhizobium sp. 2TAF24]|uniref:hypothetical protein n=1 Tax=Bradyrhizobium sp. 2TAF24 TaxID=3233011 RepID=UPI003F9214FB
MKSLMVAAIAAFAVVAAVLGTPRAHPVLAIEEGGSGSRSALQEAQRARSADILPEQDFEDRSLVFPREAAR